MPLGALEMVMDEFYLIFNFSFEKEKFHFFLGGGGFLLAIPLEGVVPPFPKIVLNLPRPMRSYIVKEKIHVQFSC